MKVMFITRELNGVMGGLERQIIMIANGLVSRGEEVTIVSLEKDHGAPFFQNGNEKVTFEEIVAGDPRKRASIKTRVVRQVKLMRLIKLHKPDLIVTFMIGSLILAKPASLLLRVPLVLSERNSPDIYRLTSARKLKWLYFLLIGTARRITVQFPSYILKYPRFLRRKIIAIPNEVPYFSTGKVRQTGTNVVFGYAGRFSFQKRIDLLIRSFSGLNKEHPDTKLLIFGYGEQKEKLIRLVADLDLNHAVEFRPELTRIIDVFDQIDVFCLFSLWEGFPNALAEALAYGVPSVGFSDCDGVSDLILDKVNGWKIPLTNDSLSGTMLLSRAYHGFKNGEISAYACRNSVSQYRSDEIYKKWQDVLRDSTS